MTKTKTGPAIIHDPSNTRFSITIDGLEAVLEYQLVEESATVSHERKIDFTRTFVPPEWRGRGLAEALVRAGLGWAKEQGYSISASCWYVQKFLK